MSAAGGDELAVPAPVYSSESESDVEEEEHAVAGSAGARMAAVLNTIISGRADAVAPRLLQAEFWREIGAEDGLHVGEWPALGALEGAAAAQAEAMRESVRLRGYCQAADETCARADAVVLERVKRGLRTLQRRGFAPAFIYVYDEAWHVLEGCWRLLGHVLSPEAPEDVVLEPAFNAHVLTRPGPPEDAAATSSAQHAERNSAQCRYVGRSPAC